MGYYSYKIEHDFGLAPNPFGAYCTLAICKGSIRRNKKLKIGDWIIGTGSTKLNNLHHLIYMMQVEELISFDEYWMDARFQYKKPVLNGSLVQLYGDNIYHMEGDTWVQEDSAHSLANGIINEGHLKADINGEHVLISTKFYYFGNQCIKIPNRFLDVCNGGRDMKSVSIPEDIGAEFVKWVQESYSKGIHGDPINWENHK